MKLSQACSLDCELPAGIVPVPASCNPTASGYLPTLDGWRAIAILGVLVCHGSDALFNNSGLYPSDRWYGLTRYGAFGVDIFFGLSGFLICTRLLQERRRDGDISLAGFYIRRAFRILPPYLTYLIIVGLLGYVGVLTVHRWEWLSSLLFFRNYIAAREGGWYLAHFWSLAVEEHFYLIWPGLLVLLGSRRARWAAVILALSVAAWRVLDFREQWLSHLVGADCYIRTDARLDALLWGCWIALMLDSPGGRAFLTSRMTLAAWTTLFGTLVCCVAYRPPLAMLWEAMLVPLVLAGTVLKPASLVGRFLESQPMRWIGRISYSLYVWQQLFLVRSQEPHPLPMGLLRAFPINIVCVFVVAAASYYLIERPLIGVGHSLSSRITSKETSAGVEMVAAPRLPDGSATERYACSG